jgi:hypothetical protein
MKNFLLLCAFSAFAFAQETPAPAAVEGVRGVRQEGSGKVKEIDPAAKNVAPTTVQGVEKVDGVKAPGGAKPVKQAPPPASVTATAKPVEGGPPPPAPKGVEAVKGVKPPEAVKGAGTKATPPPPPAKGLAGVKGVKPPEGVKPAAGGIKPVEGVTGIGSGKQENLEAALQVEAAGKPGPKKAKAAAALLAGPEPKGKPTKTDDRKVFEEARKIPDNGS